MRGSRCVAFSRFGCAAFVVAVAIFLLSRCTHVCCVTFALPLRFSLNTRLLRCTYVVHVDPAGSLSGLPHARSHTTRIAVYMVGCARIAYLGSAVTCVARTHTPRRTRVCSCRVTLRLDSSPLPLRCSFSLPHAVRIHTTRLYTRLPVPLHTLLGLRSRAFTARFALLRFAGYVTHVRLVAALHRIALLRVVAIRALYVGLLAHRLRPVVHTLHTALVTDAFYATTHTHCTYAPRAAFYGCRMRISRARCLLPCRTVCCGCVYRCRAVRSHVRALRFSGRCGPLGCHTFVTHFAGCALVGYALRVVRVWLRIACIAAHTAVTPCTVCGRLLRLQFRWLLVAAHARIPHAHYPALPRIAAVVTAHLRGSTVTRTVTHAPHIYRHAHGSPRCSCGCYARSRCVGCRSPVTHVTRGLPRYCCCAVAYCVYVRFRILDCTLTHTPTTPRCRLPLPQFGSLISSRLPRCAPCVSRLPLRACTVVAFYGYACAGYARFLSGLPGRTFTVGCRAVTLYARSTTHATHGSPCPVCRTHALRHWLPHVCYRCGYIPVVGFSAAGFARFPYVAVPVVYALVAGCARDRYVTFLDLHFARCYARCCCDSALPLPCVAARCCCCYITRWVTCVLAVLPRALLPLPGSLSLVGSSPPPLSLSSPLVTLRCTPLAVTRRYARASLDFTAVGFARLLLPSISSFTHAHCPLLRVTALHTPRLPFPHYCLYGFTYRRVRLPLRLYPLRCAFATSLRLRLCRGLVAVGCTFTPALRPVVRTAVLALRCTAAPFAVACDTPRPLLRAAAPAVTVALRFALRVTGVRCHAFAIPLYIATRYHLLRWLLVYLSYGCADAFARFCWLRFILAATYRAVYAGLRLPARAADAPPRLRLLPHGCIAFSCAPHVTADCLHSGSLSGYALHIYYAHLPVYFCRATVGCCCTVTLLPLFFFLPAAATHAHAHAFSHGLPFCLYFGSYVRLLRLVRVCRATLWFGCYARHGLVTRCRCGYLWFTVRAHVCVAAHGCARLPLRLRGLRLLRLDLVWLLLPVALTPTRSFTRLPHGYAVVLPSTHAYTTVSFTRARSRSSSRLPAALPLHALRLVTPYTGSHTATCRVPLPASRGYACGHTLPSRFLVAAHHRVCISLRLHLHVTIFCRGWLPVAVYRCPCARSGCTRSRVGSTPRTRGYTPCTTGSDSTPLHGLRIRLDYTLLHCHGFVTLPFGLHFTYTRTAVCLYLPLRIARISRLRLVTRSIGLFGLPLPPLPVRTPRVCSARTPRLHTTTAPLLRMPHAPLPRSAAFTCCCSSYHFAAVHALHGYCGYAHTARLRFTDRQLVYVAPRYLIWILLLHLRYLLFGYARRTHVTARLRALPAWLLLYFGLPPFTLPAPRCGLPDRAHAPLCWIAPSQLDCCTARVTHAPLRLLGYFVTARLLHAYAAFTAHRTRSSPVTHTRHTRDGSLVLSFGCLDLWLRVGLLPLRDLSGCAAGHTRADISPDIHARAHFAIHTARAVTVAYVRLRTAHTPTHAVTAARSRLDLPRVVALLLRFTDLRASLLRGCVGYARCVFAVLCRLLDLRISGLPRCSCALHFTFIYIACFTFLLTVRLPWVTGYGLRTRCLFTYPHIAAHAATVPWIAVMVYAALRCRYLGSRLRGAAHCRIPFPRALYAVVTRVARAFTGRTRGLRADLGCGYCPVLSPLVYRFTVAFYRVYWFAARFARFAHVTCALPPLRYRSSSFVTGVGLYVTTRLLLRTPGCYRDLVYATHIATLYAVATLLPAGYTATLRRIFHTHISPSHGSTLVHAFYVYAYDTAVHAHVLAPHTCLDPRGLPLRCRVPPAPHYHLAADATTARTLYRHYVAAFALPHAGHLGLLGCCAHHTRARAVPDLLPRIARTRTLFCRVADWISTHLWIAALRIWIFVAFTRARAFTR